MLRKRIIGGVAAMAANRVVIMLVQLALIPVLANAWGVETYGVWVMAMTIPALLAFADLGFATAAGTQMAMELERDDRGAAAATYRNAFGLTSAIGLAIALAGALAAWTVPDGWLAAAPGLPRGDLRAILAILALFAAFAIQSPVGFAAIRATGRTALAVNFHSCMYASENLIVAGVALAGGTPLAAAAGMLASRVLFVVAQSLLLVQREPWLRHGLLWHDWPGVKRLAAPANAAMVISVGQGVLLQGVTLALGTAASAAVVPLFTATRTLSRLGTQLTAIVSSTIMPEFSRATAAGNRPLIAKFLVLTVGSAAAMVVPFALILGLFGRAIVLEWTRHAIDPSWLLVALMALSAALNGLWSPLSILLVAMQRQARFAYRFLALAIAAIPVTYLLAPALGAVGAAATFLAVDAAMFVLIARLIAELPVTRPELGRASRELLAQARAVVTRDAARSRR